MKKEIQEMPKVILHLHLDGSLRPETVKEWIEEIAGKECNLEKVKKQLMVEKDCRDLNQYLEKFDLPVKLLQTKEHIERATYELFEDLAKQNVIYAEVRFAPSKHIAAGLSYNEVVESAIKGMNKAKEQFEIGGNLILCCMRDENNESEHLETIKTAKKYLNKGVCAIDLAGAEALFKTQKFKKTFEIATKEKIPFTIHAGEADGIESIKTALEFGTNRIGHGVRVVEDDKLVEYLAKNGIPLEVCVISNLQTQAVKGEHPLEKLYKKGVTTTINTDNDTVSNTNILEEIEYILENTGLKIEDILNMQINAARNIFGELQEKTNLIKQINDYRERTQQKINC